MYRSSMTESIRHTTLQNHAPTGTGRRGERANSPMRNHLARCGAASARASLVCHVATQDEESQSDSGPRSLRTLVFSRGLRGKGHRRRETDPSLVNGQPKSRGAGPCLVAVPCRARRELLFCKQGLHGTVDLGVFEVGEPQVPLAIQQVVIGVGIDMKGVDCRVVDVNGDRVGNL